MEAAYGKIIPFILLLGVAVLIAGVMGVIISGFGATMDRCYNASFSYNSTSSDHCWNITKTEVAAGCCGQGGQNLTDQYYIKVQGMSSQITLAQQFPTIGIIVVMVLIIIALVSVFGYLGYKKLQ